MSETKHSPGPWTCEGPGEPVKDASGEVVALVYSEDHKSKRYYWQCGMANRNLIASAPDLLEALEEVRNYQGGADNALEDEYVMARVDAALARARGEG